MNSFKNILMVYPEVPVNTYWSFNYALRFIRKKSAMPPLGLVTIAALFPEDYSLKLVDLNIETIQEEDIQWADMVFISAMIVQKDSMDQVVAMSNRLKTPVVAGGPYPTSSYKEISGVDYFVLGEVEDTLKNFLSDLEKGIARHTYLPAPRPNLSNSPVPRFDLLKMDAYGSMSIQFCRGCPFKCEFCDIWKTYGNKPRVKPVENVLAELDELYRLGWRGAVFIVDDNFIGNKKEVRENLLPALKRWQAIHHFDFRFFTEASINLADDDKLLSAMRDAGFNEVFVGIETPSLASLKETGKVQNLKTDLLRAIQTIQRYGMEVMAGFILGFDSDTEDIFERQIEFIQRSGIPKAMVGILSALPGTELHDRLQREGRMLSGSRGNNTHTLSVNFISRMGNEQLKKGYEQVLATLYDTTLKNYFIRCNQLLDNLGENPLFRRKIGLNEIRMLFKSLIRQPFTAYGYQYVKFVLRNSIRNFHSFSEVIRFGIIGHHFHTITQETLKIETLASRLESTFLSFREQIERYTLRIRVNPLETLGQVTELWQGRKRVLAEIRREIDRIHIDFREDISMKYTEMVNRMKEQIAGFVEMLKTSDPGIQNLDLKRLLSL